MTQINLASFLQISQRSLQSPNHNEAVANLLLGSLIDEENILDRNGNPVDITPSKASGWFNQTREVDLAIKDKVSNNSTLIERCKNWFEQTFIPTLNIHLVDDYYSEMKNLIEKDIHISEDKRNLILDNLKNDDYPVFLAEIFLYCLSITNLRSSEPVPTSDYYLLAECNFKCPICGNNLTENIRNSSIKKYEVIQFDFLDSNNNKLCLCRDCVDIYDVVLSVDDQQLIKNAKENLVKDNQLNDLTNSAQLEKDILGVIDSLSLLDPASIPVDLTLKATEIKNKIHSDNKMLIYDINTKVTSFYNTVRNLFSEFEGEGSINFEIIATQVRLYYLQLEEQELDQNQIFERVTQWIITKTGGNSSVIACQIVAAFFVQNCEVFHEITQ